MERKQISTPKQTDDDDNEKHKTNQKKCIMQNFLCPPPKITKQTIETLKQTYA